MRCVADSPLPRSLQIGDLKAVQSALGIQYRMEDGTHYQDVCPACRRKNLALTQDAMWRTRRCGIRAIGTLLTYGKTPR